MMNYDRILSVGLFVALLGAGTFGAASPVFAADGEKSQTSKQTKTSKMSSSSEPKRGDWGAEFGGAFAGMVGGALGTGLLTMGTAVMLSSSGDAGFPPEYAAGITGGALGGVVFTGMGAGLAGNWTGGTGKVGWGMLGSTVGGIGGFIVPVGLGAVLSASTDSNTPLVIGYVSGMTLGVGGAVTGGVLGYRMSAKPPGGGGSASASTRVRPFVSPNFDGGGRAGVSVDF